VNQVGRESANATVCEGRDLPWLQETADQDVWGDWQVTYRDVIILDPRNEVYAVYNLTSNSLADPTHRAEIKELLLAAGR
jgi:hypothetical protein